MSDGAVVESKIRLASRVIAVHCLSNALSKAILANFFSVGAHVSSRLYCPIDSIDDLPFCFRFPCGGQPNNNLLKFRLQRRLPSQILCVFEAVLVGTCPVTRLTGTWAGLLLSLRVPCTPR